MLNIKIFFLIFFEIKLLIFVESYGSLLRSQYKPGNAMYLYLLCFESYFHDPGRCIPQFVYFFESFVLYKNDVVTCDTSRNKCGYYVLVSEARKVIILVFSGTLNNNQIAKQVFSLLKQKIYYSNSGYVNKYYAESFEMVWLHAKKVFLVHRYRNYKVYITGHSMGSVFASLAAYKLSYGGYRKAKDIHLYTFGGPRFGTPEFARNFDKKVPNSWRVVVGSDFIAHFPPCKKVKNRNLKFFNKIFKKRISRPCDPNFPNGYYHHGTEIWYPAGTNRKYYVCNGKPKNEDFDCSDGLFFRKRNLRQHRYNHSEYFKDLTDKYFYMFYYKADKNCKIQKNSKIRRPKLVN
uniref:Lipase_3 domain-containing protein n=1 Tax=Strongyloides venezuelensis TaxID=75913 RepID=A0A0K0F3P6_STRVS